MSLLHELLVDTNSPQRSMRASLQAASDALRMIVSTSLQLNRSSREAPRIVVSNSSEMTRRSKSAVKELFVSAHGTGN